MQDREHFLRTYMKGLVILIEEAEKKNDIRLVNQFTDQLCLVLEELKELCRSEGETYVH